MPAAMLVLNNLEAAKPLVTALEVKGLEMKHVRDGAVALDLLKDNFFELILTDTDPPKVKGIDLIKHVQIKHPESKCVLLSKDSSSRSALNAIREGAFDYLTLPLDKNELYFCLDRILNEAVISGTPVSSADLPSRYPEIIGYSTGIKEVFRMIDKVAHTDSTVMITGESGTGKELVAQAIHRNSPRKEYLLVPVNCGAIPEELLESELFGHEKGAFTSAIRSRAGRFEIANHGTIFLDEISDMSPKLQVKILRVLQERSFERIGGTKTIEVDIRVIAATNKDLYQAVQDGRFRDDLYYRLNVIPITVPPLRDRQADIPLLINHFLQKFNHSKKKQIKGLSPEVQDMLTLFSWPGNIRELENVIERMVILAEEDILTPEDLPPRIKEAVSKPKQQNIEIPDEGIDFNKIVSEFEDQLLIQALKKANWVKNKAAKLLNLNRTTLVEKLKKKNIIRPAV
ncbi:MAG: sigma-54-dependent Fis family transcriptional regulator [Deltaproteobacteria bacterium]|nr:sigma-54-dependent Fis family transcriptional regulator [Deltaproteobacteria bacterium]MBW2052671.1 sigma-54-dependent Fis family transcriptional regulator [Deltaproteobacteria bacterium]MBW2322747.1 sigma-54-dependent Fis family transcriptional regulator [Deltaproteobacteria bacterium]